MVPPEPDLMKAVDVTFYLDSDDIEEIERGVEQELADSGEDKLVRHIAYEVRDLTEDEEQMLMMRT